MSDHTRGDTNAGLLVTTPQSAWQGHTTALRRLLAALLIALASVAAVAWPSAAHATALLPVDLGTLGGSDSFSTAQNELGQVAGDSITSTGAQHAFLWSRATGMVDLGSLGGPDTNSAANALSDTSQVVGFTFLSPTNATIIHAFSWTRSGGMVDLGTLGGATSVAEAVNDFGQVVGTSDTADGRHHAFVWTPTGGMADLGSLGGGYSEALAISAIGQVVGDSTTSSGQTHAFSWTPRTGMIDLGALPGGGNNVSASALNALGQITGYSDTVAGALHAFSWTPRTGMIDLGTLGGGESQASAVNLFGQIVGLSNPTGSPSLSHGGNSDAFSWTPRTGMVDLGSLGGTHNAAAAVNAAGQVAGQSQTSTGPTHAVIWLTGP
jgi:probable HAF family extracellular repeat protein